MKTKTELDETFEYKDDKQFLIRILIVAASAFLLGMAIGTGLLFAVLSLSDKV